MDTQMMDDVNVVTAEKKVLVEKRDGRVVDFDPINIIAAVKSAFLDLDKHIGPQEKQIIRELAAQVEGEIKERYNGPAKIEDIQNLVEHGLIEDHLYDVARSYTAYRLNKDIERAKATDINEAVSRLVNRDESLVRENANKDSNVYATQRDLLAGAVSKASAFSMLPDAVSNAHMKGDIHFHDADYSPFTAMSNCSLPDFGDMLAHGFALGNAMMDSPKSIGTAATQITQIIKDIAGAQYGGQTVNRADEML
ncbi:anaerobic ribonucleoside-triphosphate reductase, partial [uncultured Bifidobacterium sp.]|uniref:anaerobic ribonucleoside-triphosphate reductase n=1 Tax=uncultured Bifidobacterium sp. TaxID=165187 RepID=UPI002632B1A1